MSAISLLLQELFHENEGNSMAIHRIFRGKLVNYSAKASPYGLAKAVVSLRSAQAFLSIIILVLKGLSTQQEQYNGTNYITRRRNQY